MNNLYSMSEKECDGLLSLASEQVNFGVYAVKKDGYVELMNIHCQSKTELKQIKREFKDKGFKVFAND